jgi:hypothetical protein
MLTAGNLDFSVIRGIAFDTVILECKDDNLTVTGALTPDATGTYTPAGNFNGYPLWLLEGAPAYFCYYDPTYTTYLISEDLSTDPVTNGWVLNPFSTDPNGVYLAGGTYVGAATVTNNPTDLTGYSAEAKVRRSNKVGAEVLWDLAPVVTSPIIGQVTIPAISKDDTKDFEFLGENRWDFVLVNTISSERFGPYAMGRFVVSDNITQVIP